MARPALRLYPRQVKSESLIPQQWLFREDLSGFERILSFQEDVDGGEGGSLTCHVSRRVLLVVLTFAMSADVRSNLMTPFFFKKKQTIGPSTWKGEWTLPTLNGKAVDIDPDFVYKSPHLNAALNSDVVTATFGNYSLAYNFGDDTISRV